MSAEHPNGHDRPRELKPEDQPRELARTMICAHMVLTRVRAGSPVLVCGACPLFFVMSPNGVYLAFRADEADVLARDLVGVQRLTGIARELSIPRLVMPGE